MGKLDSLRITECPAALVDFARKHNALVDLLAAATGSGGVAVTVAENNLVVANDLSGVVADVIAALASADVTFNSVTTTSGPNNLSGDTFVDYLESAGSVYASGTVYINGGEVGRLDSVETCDPAGTHDFLIFA